jgi:hypothetical protein
MKRFTVAAAAFLFGIALAAPLSFAAGVKVTGFAPYQAFEASSGASYTADASGNVSNVTVGPDLRDLLSMGGRTLDSTLAPSANGLYATALPLLHARNSDGSVLAAAAAAGKFGVTVTLATATYLVSQAANSTTVSPIALFDVVLPRNYVAGQNITVTVNTQYVLGGGTIGTHTINANAYRTASNGTQGADMINVSAGSVGAAAADVTFTIVGTSLNPGDRVILQLAMVIQDTAGSAITGQINSVRLS